VISLDEFIRRSNVKHKNKYENGYGLVKLVDWTTKVTIICPIHGPWNQVIQSHMNAGKGCKDCAGNRKLTTEQYILNAKAVHGDTYIYDLVIYKGNKIKITIICRIHGKFEQEAKSHIMGHGCDHCGEGAELTTEEFIKRAQLIHGDLYIYNETIYIRSNKSVIIIYKKHGKFKQTPNGHLCGRGCSKCTKNISKPEIRWLNYMNIPQEYRHINFRLDGKLYRPDAYNAETNTIYEFYGDFWHGNPNVFDPNKINTKTKKTFKQLYDNTIEREEYLQSCGYNFIVVWENDWKKVERLMNLVNKELVNILNL